MTSSLRASLDLPVHNGSPAAARRVVAALLPAWGSATLTETAELLVSELVSNAVRHAPDSAFIVLELSASTRCLWIGLTDGSALNPYVLQPGANRVCCTNW